jgi:hypothetical protein
MMLLGFRSRKVEKVSLSPSRRRKNSSGIYLNREKKTQNNASTCIAGVIPQRLQLQAQITLASLSCYKLG